MPRRLGQHFLERKSILDKIAAAACPEKEALAVEIGPGRGALTEQLLARVDRLIAIEIDPYLVGYLRQKFRDEPRLEVIEGDVLKTELGRWGPAAIAGNLPYYITSPILEHVFSTPGWKRAVFLVQKEVAERMTSGHGTRDFGFLSVSVQTHSHAELLFEVSRSAFRPPPKVESAVVLLEPKPFAGDREAFLRFAASCFRHKRKTLRNNLSRAYPAIGSLPEASLRAEQLSVSQLVELFGRLKNSA